MSPVAAGIFFSRQRLQRKQAIPEGKVHSKLGKYPMFDPNISSILIVKLSAIGDVIHTLPSLSALRKLYPQAHITWVIEESASDLIRNHPDLDRVIVLCRKTWIRSFRTGQLKGIFREVRAFLRALRSRNYDLVIDFHGLLKSAAVVFLSGGNRKLGYDSMQECSGLFLNDKIHEDMEKHAVDRYLDLVRHLNDLPLKEPVFKIAIEPENQKRIDSLLEANGISGNENFIAVSPTALWDTKMWDNRKFTELCDRIIRELGIKIVFTGAENDGAIRDIRSMMEQESIDLSGRTSLRDLACLYQKALLLITTDSGPMHLGAAVNTQTIAIFGPTSPARTGPYGEGHAIIRAGLECSPCFKKKCESIKCMKAITAADVFDQVRLRLEKRR